MAIENAVLAGAALFVMAAAIPWMIHAHRAEKRRIAERDQEWIDGGCVPDEKANFYAGPVGGNGSSIGRLRPRGGAPRASAVIAHRAEVGVEQLLQCGHGPVGFIAVGPKGSLGLRDPAPGVGGRAVGPGDEVASPADRQGW